MPVTDNKSAILAGADIGEAIVRWSDCDRMILELVVSLRHLGGPWTSITGWSHRFTASSERCQPLKHAAGDA